MKLENFKTVLRFIVAKIKCTVLGHYYMYYHLEVIDDFGDNDSLKTVLCWRCKKPHPTENYNWNQAIDIPGTEAYKTIKKIGLEAYKKQRKKEGDELWKNFGPP